jgi:nitronate monooxygenase
VARLKERGIAWFACATTLAEARAAEAAGRTPSWRKDSKQVVIEAHSIRRRRSARVSIFSPCCRACHNLSIPIIATGGIADGRGVAAALILGASAVQIGTALLRCPEAKILASWAEALTELEPEGTALTRAFSGRLGRAIETSYVRAANSSEAPKPRPYPIQGSLTAGMRQSGQESNDVQRICGLGGAERRSRPTRASE